MSTLRNINIGTLLARSLLAFLAVATLALAGCRENAYLARRDTITLSAGNAAAHNRAIHTIDPWPALSKNTDLPADGKRMMVGIKRYQENKSLEPEGTRTTDKVLDNEDGPPQAPPAP